MSIVSSNWLFSTDITVGWDRISYTVSEDFNDDVTFEACYSIVFPPSIGDLQLIMHVDTIAGTAGKNIASTVYIISNICLPKGEMDYIPIRSRFFEMERVLTDASRSACVDVTIRMDNVYEDTEEFSIKLLYAMPSGSFFVIPSITTVTIMDTTGECMRCK